MRTSQISDVGVRVLFRSLSVSDLSPESVIFSFSRIFGVNTFQESGVAYIIMTSCACKMESKY
jgi:hypothetical protein